MDPATIKLFKYEEAWEAVGLGTGSSCANVYLNEQELNFLKIYPNPLTANVNINVYSGLLGSTLSILSTDGIEVVRLETISKENTELDLSSLEPGIYIVIIKKDQQVFTRRIIKQRD